MKNFLKRGDRRGWTLIEMMLTIGIMGLVIPSLTTLFTVAFQGLSTVEMHLELKQMNELIQLHLHEQLNSNRHMFQNNSTSGGTNFIGLISLTASGAPASVSFSQMPVAQPVNSFSVAGGAVSTDFGDCLFYADADRPQTINGKAYTAPITVTGVQNGAGNTVTMNLDVYRFYYDYLSTAGDLKPIKGGVYTTSYWLIEWQSVQFVDAFELEDIGNTDPTLETNVIKWLTTSGNFPSGGAISYAYDPTQTTLVSTTTTTTYAFYTLSNGGSMTGQSTFTIPMQNYTPLSRTGTGAIANYNYGISGNNPVLASTYYNGSYPPPAVVPQFCPPSASVTGFPGGFEVGIQSSAGGMQVLVRSFLIAKGNSKTMLWDDSCSVNNTRDVW